MPNRLGSQVEKAIYLAKSLSDTSSAQKALRLSAPEVQRLGCFASCGCRSHNTQCAPKTLNIYNLCAKSAS